MNRMKFERKDSVMPFDTAKEVSSHLSNKSEKLSKPTLINYSCYLKFSLPRRGKFFQCAHVMLTDTLMVPSFHLTIFSQSRAEMQKESATELEV